MKYEVDFIGIDEEAQNADAICFRFLNKNTQKYVVGVYDGGTQKYGEALKEHLLKYYFGKDENPKIDIVICSHPDQDHSSGLSIILDNFDVDHLVMNRPWLYVDDIFDKVNDGRMTKQSLENRLRSSYSYINNLELIALRKGIEIHEAFQGLTMFDFLHTLSPSKQFYLELLVESNKTPLSASSTKGYLFSEILKAVQKLIESWTNELLRENVHTSAENETSVILYGNMEDDSFLLTGDAGIRALDSSIKYANNIGFDLKKVCFQQIPHHGGRHNVSPSILNNLLGPIVDETATLNRSAYVSVSKGSAHPRKMVTNAYIRRGVKVYETRTKTMHHSSGIERSGWSAASKLEFCEQVEEWDS